MQSVACYYRRYSRFCDRSRSLVRMTVLETDISGISHDGRGVAHVDGKAIFVVGALAGERVRLKFTGKHRRYDEAVVEEVIVASPDRVVPRCPHFGVCGGCALQHLSPEAQIAGKQRVLIENLERIGKVEAQQILPPLTDQPWGYRRKARLSVKFVEKKAGSSSGFARSKDVSSPTFIVAKYFIRRSVRK